MEWLNLSITDLSCTAFRRSTLEDRGLWLTLLGYCVQQENGGTITNAAEWTEWDYMQVLGIPKEFLAGPHLLWGYNGPDLLVQGYPHAKQSEIEAKRKAARKGNRIRWASDKSANRTAIQTPNPEGEGEGEGEGKGETEDSGAVPFRPSLHDWLYYAQEYAPSWPESDARGAFDHYEACGWRMGEGRGKPVKDWRACVRTCARRWHEKNAGVVANSGLFIEGPAQTEAKA